jgi:hypothetical protein
VTPSLGAGMLARMCRLATLTWLLGALLLFSSCGSGTETGNPSLSGALSYTGYSSRPQEIGVREAASIATVETAWFELEQVTVSQEGTCGVGGNEAFYVPALGVGDHAAGRHNSTAFVGTPATYCNVELPFGRVAEQAAGVPSELRGHALLLEGSLPDGTPFSIVSDATPALVLGAESGGFELEPGSADVLIAFDFASWLADVDFASAERSGDAIVISAAENSELLAAFEARLASGVVLYRDRDADGVLDAEPEVLARAP